MANGLLPSQRFNPTFYKGRRYVFDPATGRIVLQGQEGQESQPVSLVRYGDIDITTAGLPGTEPRSKTLSSQEAVDRARELGTEFGLGYGYAPPGEGRGAEGSVRSENTPGTIHDTTGNPLGFSGAVGAITGSGAIGQAASSALPAGAGFASGLLGKVMRSVAGPYGLVGMENVGIGHPDWGKKMDLINEMKARNKEFEGFGFGNFLHDITGGLLGKSYDEVTEERWEADGYGVAGTGGPRRGGVRGSSSKGGRGAEAREKARSNYRDTSPGRRGARESTRGGGGAEGSGGRGAGARDNTSEGRDHQGY